MSETLTEIDDKQARFVQLLIERKLDAKSISLREGDHWVNDEDLQKIAQLRAEVFGEPEPLAYRSEELSGTLLQPTISLEDARANLTDAIKLRTEREADAALAATAVERANLRLETLNRELDQYGNLDEQTVTYEIEAIKGGYDVELPHTLQHRISEKGKLISRLEAAQRALDRLQAEHRTVQLHAVQAAQQASQAAVVVISAAINGHVSAIIGHEQQARELRIALHSFASTWFQSAGSGPKPAAVSYQIVQLLRDPPVNAVTASDPQMIQEYQALFSRLLSNPDAEIG